MTTKYRDLRFLVSFGVQLWMYATPVIYPLSEMKNNYPDKIWLIVANPLTAITETLKYGFTGVGVLEWSYVLYSLAFVVVIEEMTRPNPRPMQASIRMSSGKRQIVQLTLKPPSVTA